MEVKAWLIVSAHGECILRDKTAALNYAAQHHGQLYPLVVGEPESVPVLLKPCAPGQSSPASH